MIDLSPLKASLDGKKIAVVGLGASGLPVIAACAAAGIPCIAWDDNAAARDAAAKTGAEIAEPSDENIKDVALVCLAPGIPLTHPAPHRIVTLARQHGVEVTGDIELFHRALPAARTIGITGTNGKSTTTALIGHILRESGAKAAVGGNIGTAALSLPMLPPDGIYVLELSSYQLDLCQSFAPSIAVFINISPDHLDRHGDLKGYVAAKERIMRGHGTGIVAVDDTESAAVFHRQRKTGARDLVAVSGHQPVTKGVCVNNEGLLCDDTDVVTDLKDCPALQGRHNWQNAALAYAACRAAGVPRDRIVAALKTFPGLSHRQHILGTLNGIRYINDSKATNDDAAATALRAFDPVYWIAGGRSKGSGYAACEQELARVRHAFLIGEAEEEMARWLESRGIPHTRCGTLQEAAAPAHEMAQRERPAGGVVLLSPACASFDQFKSFEHRGDVFRVGVAAIPGIVRPGASGSGSGTGARS
jgi:UDP-N-acetylmuramoylalanine--D-glutamate ligase